MGLLTLIINFIAGAFVMLAISKNAPKFDNPKVNVDTFVT